MDPFTPILFEWGMTPQCRNYTDIRTVEFPFNSCTGCRSVLSVEAVLTYFHLENQQNVQFDWGGQTFAYDSTYLLSYLPLFPEATCGFTDVPEVCDCCQQLFFTYENWIFDDSSSEALIIHVLAAPTPQFGRTECVFSQSTGVSSGSPPPNYHTTACSNRL